MSDFETWWKTNEAKYGSIASVAKQAAMLGWDAAKQHHEPLAPLPWQALWNAWPSGSNEALLPFHIIVVKNGEQYELDWLEPFTVDGVEKKFFAENNGVPTHWMTPSIFARVAPQCVRDHLMPLDKETQTRFQKRALVYNQSRLAMPDLCKRIRLERCPHGVSPQNTCAQCD